MILQEQPREIITEIISYLDYKSLVHFSYTSKHYHSFVNSCNDLVKDKRYQRLCDIFFEELLVSPIPIARLQFVLDKKLYIIFYMPNFQQYYIRYENDCVCQIILAEDVKKFKSLIIKYHLSLNIRLVKLGGYRPSSRVKDLPGVIITDLPDHENVYLTF